MSHRVRRRALLTLAGCLLLALPALAADTPTGNLVDVKWLEQRLDDPGVLILDASPAPAYAAQHIRGAINVNAFIYGGQEIPTADAERQYRAWGVSPGKKVVLYDQGGSFMATRLFYSFYYHGFPVKDLAVLDGGLAKWLEAGLPVTKEPTPPPKPGTFTVGKTHEDVRVRLPEVLAASGDPRYVLVDALGADWHYGEVAPFDRPGHIPFSLLLPSADLYNADKTFKSPEELRRMLAYLGVRPDHQIYTYCGGGVAASAPLFALKFVLGYPNVKMFPESELGWLSDERKLPHWTYDAPYLLRDTRWLQWMGGQMVRAYVGTSVSVLDVRPADAFAAGHVPFALNVPGSVFRSHVKDLAGLAAALGPAGVDASHEAIVVSGAGLTPDAALAFVLLQALGQRKVSVFSDSLEEWTGQGFQLTKDPTPVGPKKSPRDLMIEPKPYVTAVREGLIIGDATSTRGLYPKVFVNSGRTPPASVADGSVHVPYSDLLEANGKPKAAKDIWRILSKAGVPRYAELICVSDDPGEAAANYVILKLMGHPDVKVLVK